MEQPPLEVCGQSYNRPGHIFTLVSGREPKNTSPPSSNVLPRLGGSGNFRDLLVVSKNCERGAIVAVQPVNGVDLSYERVAIHGGILLLGFTPRQQVVVRAWADGQYLGQQTFSPGE